MWTIQCRLLPCGKMVQNVAFLTTDPLPPAHHRTGIVSLLDDGHRGTGFPPGSASGSCGHSGGFPDTLQGDLSGKHSAKLDAQRRAQPRLERGSPGCGDSSSVLHRTMQNHRLSPRCWPDSQKLLEPGGGCGWEWLTGGESRGVERALRSFFGS